MKRELFLNESEETIEAIRSGEVDAFVVGREGREKVLLLHASDPPWRTIVEEMAQGAVTLTRDGEVAYCNPEFSILTGRSRHDILGQYFKEFVSEASRPSFRDLMARTTDAEAEIELRSAVGTVVPVIAARSILPDDEEARCCMVFADLREQRLRDRLRLEKEAAEEASRMKDDFLAMASHELRTPLTSIMGWAQYVLRLSELDQETARRAIDSIQQSAKTLSKLVDDILDSSRLSSGKLSLDRRELDIRKIGTAVAELMSFDFDARQLTLNLEMPDHKVYVLGDAERLQQVFVNLLNNAARHSTAGGMITFRVGVEGDRVRVVVADYGEGIDASLMPHLFEAFRQGEAERAHRGLGLGLWIVQQLVEAHGGTVTAQSLGKGHGATFTVELPLLT